MFERINYKNLVKGETYYIRISERLGYIITFVSFSNFVSCKNVHLYNFKTNFLLCSLLLILYIDISFLI